MNASRRLTVAVAALMAAQSSLGLVLPQQYRDADWIRATWFGNDWVTLVAAVPLISVSPVLAGRGSIRALLLWLGLLGYAVYNYAYYLFGAALNVFFALYLSAFVLSVAALVASLSQVDVRRVAAHVRPGALTRVIGAYLICVGTGLAVVWLGIWAAYVFAGRPTPVEPEAFKLIAALDLSVMSTTLIFGGVLLWRRHPWGPIVAAIGAVQGALYLIVLSVNAAVAIARGLAEAPGEIPVWGTLAVLTGTAALILLKSVDGSPSHRARIAT
jgi:hypothetical protein